MLIFFVEKVNQINSLLLACLLWICLFGRKSKLRISMPSIVTRRLRSASLYQQIFTWLREVALNNFKRQSMYHGTAVGRTLIKKSFKCNKNKRNKLRNMLVWNIILQIWSFVQIVFNNIFQSECPRRFRLDQKCLDSGYLLDIICSWFSSKTEFEKIFPKLHRVRILMHSMWISKVLFVQKEFRNFEAFYAWPNMRSSYLHRHSISF